MTTELIPVRGCWVRQYYPDSEKFRTGVVVDTAEAIRTNRVKVRWMTTDRAETVVPVRDLKCGFSNGTEVEDAAPDIGTVSLGIGTAMQVRNLAGFEQVLVDFPETGEKHWLPFQNLRQIKGPRHRFATGDRGRPEDAERMRLRMLAHAISVWNENTGALSHLDIDPLPHQIHLVHHILASGNFNWLIADDVGLGKTIETGMLIAALRQRELAQRILLITPAGLTRQWKDELYHKFHLGDFEIYGEDFHIQETRHWKMHDCVIGSMDRLKQESHLTSLMQSGRWDLVIFDEGHRLSRRQYGQRQEAADRYVLAESLRPLARHMLILSATPHQGMQDKFIALLELLRPDRKQELLTFSLHPEILRDMVYRNHKADVTDADGNFIFQGKVTRAMRVPASDASREFDKTLQDYLRKGYDAGAAMGQKGNAIGFVMTVYRKLAASSAAAIHRSLCNRLQRLQSEQRDRVQSDDEVDQRYFGEWEENVTGEATEFFDGEINLLKDVIADARQLMSEDLKLDLFVKEVIRPIISINATEKVLIFTEYRTTQEYLRDALAAVFGMDKVALINGSMSHEDRRRAIASFEDEGQFLVSTEAGGEGINLQRQCNIMVNYDLPWNPMRLVQRIGRLYRYGQKKKVVVFNIHAPGTLDQDIINMMYTRIDNVVSDMASVQQHEFNDALKDEILGEMAELIDIEDILREATLTGVVRTAERIDQALALAKSATAKQREIFQHAASYDPAELRGELAITRDHLQSFVLGMFNQLGIEVVNPNAKGGIIRVRLSEIVKRELGMPNRASSQLEVTLDRDLAATRPDTQMMDVNNPLMQYLLSKAKSYGFGGLSALVNTDCLKTGAVLSALLRWQDSQGRRMRNEFVMMHVAEGTAKLNPPTLSDWLLKPAESGESFPEIDNKEQLEKAQFLVNQRLASASNRFLFPENQQWTSAGWIIQT